MIQTNFKNQKVHVDIRAYELVARLLANHREDTTAASTAIRRLKGPADRARKKAERALVATPQKDELADLTKLADDVFSIYIRTRDTRPYPDGIRRGHCVTCGRLLSYASGQDNCGHWEQRDRWGIRFHEINCHLQCFIPCNSKSHGNGRKPEHEAAIRILHPVKPGEVEWPERLLIIQKRDPRKKTAYELRAIIELFRKKTEEILAREKAQA